MNAPSWSIPLLLTILVFFTAWKYPPAEGEYSGLRRLAFLGFATVASVVIWIVYAILIWGE